MEAATQAQAPAAQASAPPPQPQAAPPQPGAGATSAGTSQWYNDFKSQELKTFAEQKKFISPEQVVERYLNLEKLKGVPAERLLQLPEKMEGEDAKVIFEKLGAPKEFQGYELTKEKVQDQAFLKWAENAFVKSNLTKSQAQSLTDTYNEFLKQNSHAQQEARANMIKQHDEALKKQWGAQYEANVNLAKQGAKALGLDQKTVDIMEMIQGRETLLKTLQKIGVGVGEANFVDGNTAAPKAMTQEEAQAEIRQLMQDRKFQKAWNKGDKDAIDRWNKLNQLAAPGEKPIG